jgi:hypothetical protein
VARKLSTSSAVIAPSGNVTDDQQLDARLVRWLWAAMFHAATPILA